MTHKMQRLDANDNAFFARQLEHIRAGAFEVQFPELEARRFVPVNSSVSPGAEVFTYRYFEHFGVADEIKSYSQDLPRADVNGKEASSMIRGIGASYGYSVQEIRAAQLAGMDLQGNKARACRMAIEQKLDDIAWLGGLGLNGLASLSGTRTHTVAGALTALTPDAAVQDLHAAVHDIVSASKGVERPDTMLMPLSRFNYIASTRMTDGSDVTILRHFQQTSPYIRNVEPAYKLETAGAGSATRTIVYKRSPDKLELIMPLEFTQHAPEDRGLESVTACEARTGGVVIYYPQSMSYADGW